MNINELQRNLILVYSRVSGGKDLTKCGYEIEDHVIEDNETGYIETAGVIIGEGVCVKVIREWVDVGSEYAEYELEDEYIDMDLHTLIYSI